MIDVYTCWHGYQLEICSECEDRMESKLAAFEKSHAEVVRQRDEAVKALEKIKSMCDCFGSPEGCSCDQEWANEALGIIRREGK